MTDWSLRGANVQVVTVGTGNFAPTETSGAAAGDWIGVSVNVRNGEVPTMGADWTPITSSPTTSNAAAGSSTGIGQVFAWECTRGASAPDYTVTRGAGADVAMYTILTLPPASGKRIVVDSYSSNTLGAGGTTASTGSVTTPQNDCLIWAICGSGRVSSASAFDATSPSVDSGASSTGYTGTLTTEVWERRGNNNSTSGFDIGMAHAIAVKDTAGATGTITATLSSANRAGMIAVVLKQIPTGAATANGTTNTVTASVVAGSASTTTTPGGATLTATASLASVGAATGEAEKAGVTITSTASVSTSGAATGAAAASGQVLASNTFVFPGTATGGTLKIATLIDEFATLDTLKWTKTEANAGDVTVSGGQLLIKARTSYPKIESVGTYDLDESAIYVKLDDPGANTGVAGREVYFFVHDAANANGYGMFVTSDGSLNVQRTIASATTYPYSVAYNATTMRYLRIREASSTVYFERSADLSSWTTMHSFASAAFITAVKVRLQAGNWAADESPIRVAAWDSVNASAGASIGQTVTSTSSVVSGTATGAAATSAATITTTASVIAGTTSVSDVEVPGQTVTTTSSLSTVGAATGAAAFSGLVVGSTSSIVAGAATGTLPKLATLTDSFDILDLGRWTKHNEGTAGDITVSGGTLNLKATGDYSVFRSVSAYDATSSQFIIQMSPGDVTGVSGREVGFELFKSSTERYGVIFLSTGSLFMYRYEGGSQTTQATAPYNATEMNWLRIREAGGVVYWDKSPNGVTWTQMSSRTAGFAMTSVKVDIYAGNFNGTETPARVATFDNVGFVPGLASGATLTTTASLSTVGVATGSGSPAGQTITITGSLIAGTVSAGTFPTGGYSFLVDASAAYLIDAADAFLIEPVYDVEASGAVLTVGSSLVAGTATEINSAFTFLVDSTLAYLVDAGINPLIEPYTVQAGNASGSVISTGLTIIPGAASVIGAYTYLVDSADFYLVDSNGDYLIEPGGVEVSGATVTSTASVIAGAVSGGVTIPAALLTSTASIVSGTASTGTGAAATGATTTTTSSVEAGLATGASGSTVPGTLIASQLFLERGAATGAAASSGVTNTSTSSIVAGSAGVGAAGSASGVTNITTASLISGTASSETIIDGVILPFSFSVVPGELTAEAVFDGATVVSSASLIAGHASGFRRQVNASILLTGI